MKSGQRMGRQFQFSPQWLEERFIYELHRVLPHDRAELDPSLNILGHAWSRYRKSAEPVEQPPQARSKQLRSALQSMCVTQPEEFVMFAGFLTTALLSSEVNSDEVADLNHQIKQLDGLNSRLQAELHTARGSALKPGQRDEVHELRAELDDAMLRNAKLITHLSESEALSNQLETQVQELQRGDEAMKSDAQLTADFLVGSDAQPPRASSTMLQMKLDEVVKRNARLTAELFASESKSAELKEQLSQRSGVQSDTIGLQMLFEEEREKCQDLEYHARTLQEQLNEARNAAAHAQTELSEVLLNYHQLQAEARKLDAQLASEFLQPAAGASQEVRAAGLRQVFHLLDTEGSGQLSEQQLFKFGQSRRELGQVHSEWNKQMNTELVNLIDPSGRGLIDQASFMDVFNRSLPAHQQEFETALDKFMAAAVHSRGSNQADLSALVLQLEDANSVNKELLGRVKQCELELEFSRALITGYKPGMRSPSKHDLI
eukprot:TRINITY_DN19025_c0_g1_i2.p1 TRINITY_DN19025_c0_g1~~TRINITY_DN19025_c0_g1_i2.p1  ORF type:complete len:489 (+),score=139.39 TRINITY_DN19025_c0_g1_i2:97-1563(+)